MSQEYIRSHYNDIEKYASVIEDRLDDSYCTMDMLLKDNAQALGKCLEYGVEYILIDQEYVVDVEDIL